MLPGVMAREWGMSSHLAAATPSGCLYPALWLGYSACFMPKLSFFFNFYYYLFFIASSEYTAQFPSRRWGCKRVANNTTPCTAHINTYKNNAVMSKSALHTPIISFLSLCMRLISLAVSCCESGCSHPWERRWGSYVDCRQMQLQSFEATKFSLLKV